MNYYNKRSSPSKTQSRTIKAWLRGFVELLLAAGLVLGAAAMLGALSEVDSRWRPSFSWQVGARGRQPVTAGPSPTRGVPSPSATFARDEPPQNDPDPEQAAGTPSPGKAADKAVSYRPVASYQIDAKLDTERHQVSGKAIIRWHNSSNTVQSKLYLHLYLNAFKHEKTLFFRSPACRGFRGNSVPSHFGRIDVERFYVREFAADLWPPNTGSAGGDETDVRIPLPEPVPPGQSLTIDVQFVSHLPPVVLRTGYAGRFHMVAQWFPKLARLEPNGRWAHFPYHCLSEFYADYGDYDVWIDTPAEYVVAATGKLVADRAAGQRRRRHYVQSQIHDFAFTAWDQFQELSESTRSGVELRVLYPPGRETTARLELKIASDGLDYFTRHYGPYPYSVLTVVHPPAFAAEAGGMEYPTLITTGGSWYLPLLGRRGIEQVTIHELAHQWFYGLVGTNEHEFPFLDEGLATYAEGEALEAWMPNGSFADSWVARIGLPAVDRYAAARVATNDVIAQRADEFADGFDYGGLVYSRTATLLRTIARVYGAAKFKAAVGQFARDHRFGHPVPDDLIAAVRQRVGAPAAWQLRKGLFKLGWVDYVVQRVESESVTGDVNRDQKGLHRGHVLVRRRGNLAFPVQVELWGESGPLERVAWDGQGRHTTIAYQGDSRLTAAVVDPDTRVLLDQDLSNNARRAKGHQGPSWARRTLTYGAYGVQLLLALLGP